MTSETEHINALRDASHRQSPRMLRKAIQAARSDMTDEQIAGELGVTPEKVDELGRDLAAS